MIPNQPQKNSFSVEAFMIESLLQSKNNSLLSEESRKRLEKLQTTNKFIVETTEGLNNLVNGSDRYFAHSDRVRGWIEQDEKRRLFEDQSKEEEEIDCALLSQLNIDIRYDIIEFIPTVGRWNSLERKFNVNSSPSWINKVLESGVGIDFPMVCYHKKRIISKEFNRRMMLKILSMDELIIVNNKYLDRIFHLLKQQEFYKNNILPDDELYLYENMPNNRATKKLFVDGFPVFQKTLERVLEDYKTFKMDKYLLIEPKLKTKRQKNLLEYDYSNVVFSPCMIKGPFPESDGNTLVKHLIILDPNCITITKYCNQLQKVTIFEATSLLSIEEAIQDVDILIHPKEEQNVIEDNFPQTLNFPNSTGTKMKNYLSLMNKRFGSKFIDYVISCIPTFNFSSIVWEDGTIELWKEILDFLVIENQLPIAGLDLYNLGNLHTELLQYLAYLANTYQNGKFILNEQIAEVIYSGIIYGWKFEENLERLLFCKWSKEALTIVLDSISLSKDLVIDLFKYHYSDDSIHDLNLLVLYMLKRQKREFIQLLSEKVECIPKRCEIYGELIHCPLLVLIVSKVTSFVLHLILQELENQDLSLYEENEFGDNLLHYIFLSLQTDDLSAYPLIDVLKKVPHLLGRENKLGVKPFDLIKHGNDPVFTNFIRNEFGQFINDNGTLITPSKNNLPDDATAVTIVVIDTIGQTDLYFKIKRNSKLEKLFKAYNTRLNREVVFRTEEGLEIDGSDTLVDLDIYEGGKIYAHDN